MSSTLEVPAAVGITEPKPKSKAPLTDRARAERALGWRLAAPAWIIMLLVTAYPIADALYLSLYNYRLTDPNGRSFIGLKNYKVILTDSLWWSAVQVTVILMVVTVVIEFFLGMALAMVMNKIVIPRKTLRTVVLIPYSIITVVSAFGWQYAFQPSTGFINHWLHFLTFGWFGSQYDWFGSHVPAMIAISVSEIWKTTPFMSLLLLAGLAQVPGELTEAAEVDGATFWERLRKVTLPSMKGAIMVALLFRSLDAFRIFDNIYIMTKGSQNTESVAFLAYNQTLTRSEIGLGSAISILLFLAVALIAFVFIKVFRTDLSSMRGE
ncbi:carbohydrate ABC transporter permease [Jatrophihabitans sp. DSM 45814]